MDDEDIVFEGSPLYNHLVNVGCGDFQCEKKVLPEIKDPDKDDNPNRRNISFSKAIGRWQEIKAMFNNYIFDESWHKQVKSLHQRSSSHVIDVSLKKRMLYEDDATYVESFSCSLSGGNTRPSFGLSDSLYGQMFLQAAVLCVTIGYGFVRMFYAKSGPAAPPVASRSSTQTTQHHGSLCCSMLIYGLDLLSLMVIVAALLPVTVRFSLVGRLVGRLESFTSCFDDFLSSVEALGRTSSRAILFVQESEVIKRGYTLVAVPICRLELGLNSCGSRECLDLRRSVFFRNRATLLAVRRASLSLLKLFPNNVELRGVKECLARRDLNEFCDYLHGWTEARGVSTVTDDEQEEEEEAVYKSTDGYSLAALKFLVELTAAHTSELIRLLSLLCLIQTNELSPGAIPGNTNARAFSDQLSIMDGLRAVVNRNLSPLDRCLTTSQAMRDRAADGNDDERKKKRGPGGGADGQEDKVEVRSIHIAIHSLKLHLESALRRVQIQDKKLESFLDRDEDGVDDDPGVRPGMAGAKLVDDIASEEKQLRRELEASRECLEELNIIITKLDKTPKAAGGSEQKEEDGKVSQEEAQKEVPIVVAGTEPVVQDEVFEGMSATAKDLEHEGDGAADVVETRKKQKDAARVISELRSVIAVRAKDTEEREKKAFMKKLIDHDKHLDGNSADPQSIPRLPDVGHPSSSAPPAVPSDPANDRPLVSEVSKVENNFNGARPKDSTRSARGRKEQQYFGDMIESSDSDEGHVSSISHNPPKGFHLRHRRHCAKTSTGNNSPCGASPEADRSKDGESEDSNGFGALLSFGHPTNGSLMHPNGFQGHFTMKGIASMAASLSGRANLGEEDMYGNDVDDDDDDVVGDEVDEDEDEMNDADNDVSDSQSGDLDSDDIYHVTDDDEGFDGVNVGYDDDDDDDR